MATGYNRVYNTVLSGNEAQSSLSGNDVRMLEFDAALKRRPAVSLASGDSSLSVEDWMQASIDTLLIANTAANNITLGPDAASQAAAYVQLFDLRSTTQQRVLRMANTAVYDVSLKNTSSGPSSTFVKVQQDGGTAANTQTLYVASAAPGTACAGNKAGLERIVVVSATDLSSGAEVVQFNILTGSL